jgi:prepilin-type N-terminal cleavage/methylation domain-containing protein
MRRPSQPPRRGYTLLEVLAATAIGVMLLAALYTAYDLTLRQTSVGRDLTADANLSRAVVNRVSLDISSAVGVLPPKSGGTPAASSSSSSSSGGGTTTGTTTTGTSGGTTTGTTTTGTTTTDAGATTGTGGTTTTTDGSTTASAATTGTDIPFQSGIVGSTQQLTAFVSKPPKYLAERHVAYDPSVAQPGDLMRVTYYLHSSGKGLCRQERPWVTADGVWNSTDPDRGTEEDDLIAPEVSNVTFEFASGSGYVSDWDGSQAGTDGSTNQGPPRAVKMTLTFEYPPERAGGTPITKTLMHVFPVRASVGPGASTTTTTTDTTTTGTTTGGN